MAGVATLARGALVGGAALRVDATARVRVADHRDAAQEVIEVSTHLVEEAGHTIAQEACVTSAVGAGRARAVSAGAARDAGAVRASLTGAGALGGAGARDAVAGLIADLAVSVAIGLRLARRVAAAAREAFVAPTGLTVRAITARKALHASASCGVALERTAVGVARAT